MIAAAAVQAGCYERAALRPGDCIDGPALISEPQTTVVVGTGYRATVSRQGALVIETAERGNEADG